MLVRLIMEKNICSWGQPAERINRKRLSNLSEKARSSIKSFSGAKTQELERYVVSQLNAQKPDVSVIQITVNIINE